MPENNELVNILIVDDREENLISLESVIEAPGRNIVRAFSGSEALKLNLEQDFDLILSDVQMPGMDGFEMLEILRTNPNKRNIPFIFITAISKEESYIKRGYDEGAVDYLFKPLNVDITRSKVDVFVELARQKKELIAKNKELKRLYEQKNQFMGILVHDLRNPIGAFQMYCDFLFEANNLNLNGEQRQLVQLMRESSTYMLNLVNDVLDLSYIDSGQMTIKMEAINLLDFVKNIISINNMFAHEKNIQIESKGLEELEKLSTILMDGPKIRQVLNNLISNAVKYSHPDTTITVMVKMDKTKIYFDVADQGQGIPANEIPTLFKAYKDTSVKSTAGEKSTGLGLLICAKIIEAHGGQIKVESTVGKGSVFSFFIPYVPFSATPEKKNGMKVNKHLLSAVILIVDDDEGNRTILERTLKKIGYDNILKAANGVEAVDMAKKNHVDVIFMDVNMPGMNGVEATQAILSSNNSKPVIIGCTGHDAMRDIKKWTDAGMTTCITKPVSIESIEEVLADL